MKHLPIILALLSFNLYSQTNEKFQISGTFKNIEYPVKTQLLLTQDDGEVLLLDEQFGLRYSYSLEQMKNYQIRFIYSPTLIKTISVIPESSGDYEMNVNFNLREKVHCVLLHEENSLYSWYLLTDQEYLGVVESILASHE